MEGESGQQENETVAIERSFASSILSVHPSVSSIASEPRDQDLDTTSTREPGTSPLATGSASL